MLRHRAPQADGAASGTNVRESRPASVRRALRVPGPGAGPAGLAGCRLDCGDRAALRARRDPDHPAARAAGAVLAGERGPARDAAASSGARLAAAVARRPGRLPGGGPEIAGTGWAPTLWLNARQHDRRRGGLPRGDPPPAAGALRLDQPRAMLSMLLVCLAGAAAEALVGGAAGPVLFGRGLVPSLLDWFNGQLASTSSCCRSSSPRPGRGRWTASSRACGRRPAGTRTTSCRWPPLPCPWPWPSCSGGGGAGLPVPALIWCALRYRSSRRWC